MEYRPPRRRGARWLLVAALAWIATWLVNRSLQRVEGPSMEPGLVDGDRLLTAPARVVPPRPGAIVVHDAPSGRVVKRVVGGPGQRVVLHDGHLGVDGEWMDEPAVVGRRDQELGWPRGDGWVTLGDHRAASTDSRDHGRVPTEAIARTVLARLRPWRWLGPRAGGRGPVGAPRPLGRPRRRPTVRVVVRDPDGRVLLFHVRDADGGPATWWEVPGGGIRPGEDAAAAARRELSEEIGHVGLDPRPLGRVEERISAVEGFQVCKVEELFTVELPDATVETSGWTASERRLTIEHRWWSLDDLREHRPATVPGDLTEVVAALDAPTG